MLERIALGLIDFFMGVSTVWFYFWISHPPIPHQTVWFIASIVGFLLIVIKDKS